jgi:hypothetical protein
MNSRKARQNVRLSLPDVLAVVVPDLRRLERKDANPVLALQYWSLMDMMEGREDSREMLLGDERNVLSNGYALPFESESHAELRHGSLVI